MEEGGGTKLGLRRRVEFRGRAKEKALEEPSKDSNRMCWEGQRGVVLSRTEVCFMMGSLVLLSACLVDAKQEPYHCATSPVPESDI